MDHYSYVIQLPKNKKMQSQTLLSLVTQSFLPWRNIFILLTFVQFLPFRVTQLEAHEKM